MLKQSVVRHVLGACLALTLLVGPSGMTAAHAQAPPRLPTQPCVQIPCAMVTTGTAWCWCPDQPLAFTPDEVQTGQRFGYAVAVVNTLPVEVDLVDRSGALAAAIPSGATGRVAVQGPGTYAYTVASPQVVSPPSLRVLALPN